MVLHVFGVSHFIEKIIALLAFQSFWFKLRSKSPCCLSNIHFDIEIPEDDNIQVDYVFDFIEWPVLETSLVTMLGKQRPFLWKSLLRLL